MTNANPDPLWRGEQRERTQARLFAALKRRRGVNVWSVVQLVADGLLTVDMAEELLNREVRNASELEWIGTPLLLDELARRADKIVQPVHQGRLRNLIAMVRRDCIGRVNELFEQFKPNGWKSPAYQAESERLSRQAAGEPNGS